MKQFFAMIAVILTASATFTTEVKAATLFASEVLFADCNLTCGGAGRDDPLAALGVGDNTFYSLGLGGELIVGFGQAFTGPGTVIEVTNGNVAGYGIESADVFVGSFATNTWTKISEVFNTTAQTGFSFSFAGIFDAMKLVDTTSFNCTLQACTGDGFDVDAISATAVPLPAAGMLLLSALGGMAYFRRRTSVGTTA